MFIGRDSELTLLKKHCARKNAKAKIIVYKGRRRIGKSTLIEHYMSKSDLPGFKIIGQPPAKVNRTTTELSNFAQQLSEQFGIQKPAFADWDAALSTLGDLVKDGNCTLLIDEINWLGKTHNDITTVLFTLWENKLKNIKGFTLILTGSLAGWILANLSESTGWYGRISLDETLKPLPLKDAIQVIPSNIKKRMNKAEQLRYLMVSGGVPSYLQSFNFNETLEQNLQTLAFSPSGALYREFDTLMQDLFRAKKDKVKTILDLLARSNLTANQMAKKLKMSKPNGHLYDDLNMMVNSAFINTIHKWDLKTGHIDRKEPTYVITDPYLRFYYKAMLPHKLKIEQGRGTLPSNLDSLLGLQFEYVMRENISLLHDELSISKKDIINEAPYQTKGLQIDWLIETQRNFYILEFKFQLNPLDTDVVRDMDRKVTKIDIPENKSTRTAVIHVNGAKDSVKESAIIDYCIDLRELI
jgi:AAA+ ATPase superfamily predicted ATPase